MGRNMAAFLTQLVMSPTADGRRYTLTEELQYRTAAGQVIRVPVGFPTDLASIPRLLWRVFPPFGRYTRAAVVHDWLCHIRMANSDWAADVFGEAMEVLAVPRWKRRWMVRAVKWFGPHW